MWGQMWKQHLVQPQNNSEGQNSVNCHIFKTKLNFKWFPQDT